ncbi:DEAD-box type RNA helicase [Coemansia sp. RSA 1813]|nr:DEAD-box type RNA helicase [Coemansia sp. RSA 1843]KAJ2091662.1 DEAD-box type RNA helicase [Coemansia sp. RSA 986]KAJ2571939.1 DEAD-box type RNA helicase [Coemansia sp. RSA 1813]
MEMSIAATSVPPPTYTPSLTELNVLLTQKRNNENSEKACLAFFQAGLDYFVNGKAQCWWCNRDSCDAAMDMLHLFSIAETDKVKEYKATFAEQLTKCEDCIFAYYAAKTTLRKRYVKQFDLQKVDAFFRLLGEWDAGRIFYNLSTADTNSTSSWSSTRITLIDALSDSATILFHHKITTAITKYALARLGSGSVLDLGNRLLPGFLALCFSADMTIRTWAWRSLKLATRKDALVPFEMVEVVFAGILGRLAAQTKFKTTCPVSSLGYEKHLERMSFSFSTHDAWHGMRVALGRLSSDIRRSLVDRFSKLPVFICQCLMQIEGDEFIQALRAFGLVIGAAEKPAVWPQISRNIGCNPEDFVLRVMGHREFGYRFESAAHHKSSKTPVDDTTISAHNNHLRPVLEWITPFIESLQLPKDSQAIVALLEELLFKVRLNTGVPQVSAAIATHTAMAIITHCLKLPTLERFMADGKHLLSEFLHANFHVISDIAQGRDSLSKSELLISGAEDLIELILREDLANMFKVFSEYNEIAECLKDDPDLFAEHDTKGKASAPVLIHFPSVWECVLKDPQNTNIVRKSVYVTSYLLLFDPIPKNLLRCLPQQWRGLYRLFEQERSVLVGLLGNVLQLLATSLDDVDPAERHEFEQEILSSQLRLLVSPWPSIHRVVLQVLRITSLDLSESESDEPQRTGGGYAAAASKQLERLSVNERDLACNELFRRHKYCFVRSLTDIANDCKVLVSCSRPAHTCSSNIALYVRSSMSVIDDKDVSEPVVRMFFAFCSLLEAILKLNANNGMQAGDYSMYMDSVLVVFNTVYVMLNSLKFAAFVNMVKNSTNFNENETMDALSMCVAQMLNYLGGDDSLGVSDMIIQMFGFIANGLAATLGTSMLYPKETVDALISGNAGRLTPMMRTKLRHTTSGSVWEARSIKVSKAKPVQIIFDDADDLSLLDGVDLSDVLDESLPADQPDIEPIVVIDEPKSGYWADLSTNNQQPSAPASSALNRAAEKPKVTQFTSSDVSHVKQMKQMSLNTWLPRDSGKADSLTAKLKQKSAQPSGTKSNSRKSNTGSVSLFDHVRSSYTSMRSDSRLGSGVQKPPSISQKVVKAPRSMAVSGFSATAQRPVKHYDPYAPAAEENTMYIRDVSEVALRELEAEKLKKGLTTNKQQQNGRSLSAGLDDSDVSSSDDESSGEAKRSYGLAGLIKIPKHSDSKLQPRRTMKMFSLVGENSKHASGPGLSGGQFFDQETRDRALAEQRAKMRLNPSLNQLYKQLLGWQYEDTGDYPPNIKQSELQKVVDTFVDCDTYSQIFEPLLVLESWAQFQRAKEEAESNDTGEATLESRTGLDDFQDITFKMTPADAEMISDNDVLVFAEALSYEKRLVISGMQGVQPKDSMPLSKKFSGRYTFLAMVKKRIFGRKGAEMVVRVYFHGSRIALMLNRMTLNSCWEFFKLYSMIPIRREYAALLSLEYLDENLVKEILCPRESLRRKALSRTEVQQVMKAHALNQPQAEAVASAIKLENGFTLIQGPPGTGKTKTILGLSGALVSSTKTMADSSDDEKNKQGLFANKLLICAPSNAAVDEIVKRLKNGIRDNTGTTFYPRVVRIGQSDSISSTVRDTTLDFLLDKALNSFDSSLNSKSANVTKGMSEQQSSLLLDIAGQNRREDGKAVAAAAGAREMQRTAQVSIKSLCSQLTEANDEIKELDVQMQKVDPSNTAAMRSLKDKYQKSKQQKRMITQKLVQERERVRGAGKAIDETKAKVRMQILQKTDILCCTLSGSGHDLLTSLNCSFETVIIDEAAQSIELSCLIPLKYGCKRCILVGDPNQLPPTVFSQPAMRHLYNQSLFVRIQKNAPQAVNLLSIQYRMHPEISVFPSRLFYESRLQDGPEMAVKQRAPWHDSTKYPPFRFFNISSGKEQVGSSHSVYNMEEVTAAVQLVYNLCMDHPDLPWKQRIGIITPYKQQLRKLVDAFVSYFGEMAKDAIEFNTVDGFQGQEKDIIIFSCVRAGEGGVGFLSDERRMNVGLTRARKSLFVLGNAGLLTVSPLWKKLIDDSRERNLLRESSLPLFGKRVVRGVRLDGLLRDVKEGNSRTKADGEGDRSEFIMEDIDESALDILNQGSPIAKQSLLQPLQLGEPMDVDVGMSGDKRKHQSATAGESAKGNYQKPNLDQKRVRLSDECLINSEDQERSNRNPARLRSVSATQSHVQQRPPRPPPPPALARDAQIAASREKQRSALFIPRKRTGRGGAAAGSREQRSASLARPASAHLPMARPSPPPPPATAIIPLPTTNAPSPALPLPQEDKQNKAHEREKRDDHKRHSKSRSSSKKSRPSEKPPKRKPGMFRPGMAGGGYSSSSSNSSKGKRRSKNKDPNDSRDDLISSMLYR